MKAFLLNTLIFFLFVGSYSQSRSKLVWPEPPQKAKIQHLQTISSLADLKIEEGFFTKILKFLFGGDDRQHWLIQPVGITVDDGLIYIADPGCGCVHVLNLPKNDYEFIDRIDNIKFISPVGVALDRKKRLFITDSQLNKVFIIEGINKFVGEIKYDFQRPTGITIRHDKIFIVETGSHKILVFDLKGNYLYSLGERGNGEGEFNFPVSIAVNNFIYIVDAMNHRIQVLDLDGKYKFSFGKIGNMAGNFTNPKSIAFDSDENLYVTDALMDNFQIFNQKGELLLVVGSKGSGDGEYLGPSGIYIDKNDKIYVVDALNRRLQILKYLK